MRLTGVSRQIIARKSVQQVQAVDFVRNVGNVSQECAILGKTVTSLKQ